MIARIVRSDWLGAALLLAASVIGFLLALRIDLSLAGTLPPLADPRAYPMMVAAVMGALALAIGVSALRAEPGNANAVRAPAQSKQLAIALIALVAFVGVLDALGYVLSMFGLLAVIAWLTGARSWLQAVAFALGCMIASVALFRYGLNIVLPEGLFSFDRWF